MENLNDCALLQSTDLPYFQKLFNGNHLPLVDNQYFSCNQDVHLRNNLHKSYELNNSFQHTLPPPPLASHPQDFLHFNNMNKTGFQTQNPYSSLPQYQYNPWTDFVNGGLSYSTNTASPTRGKQKRPSMSLQKRLLVNARERERMRILNKAFESLRDALPCYIADGHMAKITTLRLAINYISALTDLLNEHENTQAVEETEDMNNNNIENMPCSYKSKMVGDKKTCIEPLLKGIEERLNVKISDSV